ncbi:ABC transporter substrate-binding protein [Flavobacterium sp.]|uniref:ABC transporter substrate-binding protein n=1 Tax=Flavobacterium sp. TaxID=239 RepID=UPI0038FC287E
MKKSLFYFLVLLEASSLFAQIQDKALVKEQYSVNQLKPYVTLTNNSEFSKRKKLAILLPFNLVVIDADTINTLPMRLKKDKFLNMTLDFYSGALIAIDSAKIIGIPVDVSVFDSQESKLTSNVLNVIIKNELQDSDAIIGPFYQNNIENASDLLIGQNVPIISPLSKDLGNPFPNLYKSIPSNETLKSAMFDFMLKKEGNIIAVVDKKKESARQYLQLFQKNVRFAALNENGSLSVESLKSLFVKGKINYVVLETSNTGMIKWTMQTMINAMANYKVQLVILEPNETLDTDEINFDNLTKLNLMYPSITRENDSYGAQIFVKEYKKKNKIEPTNYAYRGFDLTFDTLMRLAQDNKYQETADSYATEQIINRFEYYKNEVGSYINNGIYILYYDTDFQIKEAR